MKGGRKMDVSDVNIEKPEIITPGEFIEKYI